MSTMLTTTPTQIPKGIQKKHVKIEQKTDSSSYFAQSKLEQDGKITETNSSTKTLFTKPRPLTTNLLHHDIFEPEKFRQHIENGVDINACSISGRGTPFHILIANEKQQLFFSYLEILKSSSKQQFDYTTQDNEGKTILILACKIRRPKIVKAILENSESSLFINMVDQYGMTALHYAAALGDAVSVSLLLEKNAFPLFMDNSYRTPYQYTQIKIAEINSILESIEIDPARHFNATCNSLNGLNGGDAILLAREQLALMGARISKYKRNFTLELSKKNSVNYAEILICQENRMFFDYQPPPRSMYPGTIKEIDALDNAAHNFQTSLKEEWEKIKGKNLSISENCLNGHESVRKILSKYFTENFPIIIDKKMLLKE